MGKDGESVAASLLRKARGEAVSLPRAAATSGWAHEVRRRAAHDAQTRRSNTTLKQTLER
jgi:hypothetical protein